MPAKQPRLSFETASHLSPREWLSEIGCSKIKYGKAGWVATCPLARWEHAGGRDSTPSFAIFQIDGRWYHRCFACGSKGRISQILWRLIKEGVDVSHSVMASLQDELREKPVEAPPSFSKISGAKAKPTAPTPWDRHTADRKTSSEGADREHGDEVQFSLFEAEPYRPPDPAMLVKYRHAPIPDVIIRRGWEQAYRSWGCGNRVAQRRWTMPIYLPDKTLWGYSSRLYYEGETCFRCGADIMGREPDGTVTVKKDGTRKRLNRCEKCKMLYGKWVNTPGMPKEATLLGIHRAEPGDIPLVVEGGGDALAQSAHGVKSPQAALGSAVSYEQARLLSQFDRCIICGDGDDAGRKFNDSARFMLKKLRAPEPIVIELPIQDPPIDPGNLTLDQSRDYFHQATWSLHQKGPA